MEVVIFLTLRLKELQIINSPICSRCGFPLFGNTVDSTACEKCRHLDPVFESNRSVILLNRLGRKLVHELKYHHGTYLLGDIQKTIEQSRMVRERIEDCILVPVPLHRRKLRERGYNQSLLLAEAFANVWGNTETSVESLLIRTKDTESQTLMDRKKRASNVKNAFKIDSDLPDRRDKIVTIVDDVFTTGQTIDACARVLKKAGWRRIQALTFGHG